MRTQWNIDSLYEYAEKGLVTAREHPSLPLVVWNYTAETQYGRLWDTTTLSTRGLVTDMQGRTVAPCLPKFFNLSEPENDGLTIEDYDVAQEKLDGSLIHVFWHEGQWVCSSRGSFESDHAGWAQELIEKNQNFLRVYEPMVRMNPSGYRPVFVCELIIPENRIVVDYGDEESLRLISVFQYSDEFGWEETRNDEWNWPWDKVQRIPMEAVPTYLDQSGIEGIVLIGNNGRAKIKTDEYVEHHRIVTGLTTKRVLEHYIEHGNVDKLLEVAPDEWYERIGQLAWSFQDRVQFVKAGVDNQFYNVMKSFGKDMSRKDFAMKVRGQVNASHMFSLLDGKDIVPMIQRHILDNYERFGLEL